MTKTRASNKWMTLILVAFAGGIITKLPYLRETYMAPLMEATGANATQLGLIMSAYGIVNFICYFPGGILADKFSCKSLIVFSCIGTALAGFWFWTMPSFIWLVVIHAIFAITTVFTFWAAMVKSINRLGEAEEQGRLFGLLEGGRGLIGTIAAFGSVAVFSWATNSIGGMQNAIMYYSVLMLAAGILCFIFMENDKPVAKTAEQKAAEGNPLNMKDFMEVAKMPRVWLCGLLGGAAVTGLLCAVLLTSLNQRLDQLGAAVDEIQAVDELRKENERLLQENADLQAEVDEQSSQLSQHSFEQAYRYQRMVYRMRQSEYLYYMEQFVEQGDLSMAALVMTLEDGILRPPGEDEPERFVYGGAMPPRWVPSSKSGMTRCGGC